MRYNNYLLYTPGPTNVPYRVLEAGNRPMMHHRTKEFAKILDDVIKNMKLLFKTDHDVLLVHTSGRGAMEGSILNVIDRKYEVLAVCNGKFGEMFAEIGELHGYKVNRIFNSWLEPVDTKIIDEMLAKNKNIKAVTITHTDTSTAVSNPIKEIGDIVRKHNRLFIVDCISSLATMDFQFDNWNVDVAITASQKGLMAPTGISFVAINGRAWVAMREAANRNFYINFADIKEKQSTSETPGSTPISLVNSVNEAVKIILEEGLEEVYKRHYTISIALKNSLPELGFRLFPESILNRSHSLTVLKVPDAISSSQIINMVKEKYRIILASGLGKYKDSTIRIGHMGYITLREAILVVAVLEDVMASLGASKEHGRALKAFTKSL